MTSTNKARQNGVSRVLVTGAAGMVGSAVCRALHANDIALVAVERADCDLTDKAQVTDLLARSACDAVVIAAAKVGGIHANNQYPAEFIYDNLMIEANLIESSYQYGIKRLLFLGSSCIYPRNADQPMTEDALLSGPLEPTNEPYAIAKIAGIKLCESYNRQYGTDYRSLMPTNLYGPGDNFHPENSHVIPALIHRFHRAKLDGASIVDVWGSGNPKREFLHVDDLASAAVHVLCLDRRRYDEVTDPRCSHLNVGTGTDVSIRELAEQVKITVGMKADLRFDFSKPDGTPRKLLDVGRITSLGWRPEYSLAEGLASTYRWYLAHEASIRR